jgi:hypothetical protein
VHPLQAKKKKKKKKTWFLLRILQIPYLEKHCLQISTSLTRLPAPTRIIALNRTLPIDLPLALNPDNYTNPNPKPKPKPNICTSLDPNSYTSPS